MTFKKIIPEEEEYSVSWEFDSDGSASVLKSLWVDQFESIWLESNDDQHICIPKDIRRLVSKLLKEAKQRG